MTITDRLKPVNEAYEWFKKDLDEVYGLRVHKNRSGTKTFRFSLEIDLKDSLEFSSLCIDIFDDNVTLVTGTLISRETVKDSRYFKALVNTGLHQIGKTKRRSKSSNPKLDYKGYTEDYFTILLGKMVIPTGILSKEDYRACMHQLFSKCLLYTTVNIKPEYDNYRSL